LYNLANEIKFLRSTFALLPITTETMNFIQSFWTNTKSILELKGGFPDVKFHLMSWALSSLQINKFCNNPELITDDFGKSILVDCLRLPYKKVKSDFDSFETPFHNDLWVIRKINSYASQNEPFLYIDGDVYLFAPLSESVSEAPLVAQNLEINTIFYQEPVKELRKHFNIFPSFLHTSDVIAANAGIMGGKDISFFKEYQQKIHEFLASNHPFSEKINWYSQNIVVEQHFFACLAAEKNIPITYISDQVSTRDYSPEYFRFTDLPHQCSYIHLMDGKKMISLCESLAQRLKIDYPEMYFRILETIHQLAPDTLYPINSLEEQKLFSDHYLKKEVEFFDKLPSFYQQNFTNSRAETFFYRTFYLWQNYIGQSLPTEDKVTILADCLNESIEHLAEGKEKELLEDIAGFEWEKYEFLLGLPSTQLLMTHLYHQSLQINNLLKEEQSVFLASQIGLSPFTCLIESRWNWAETNEFTLQKNSIDYPAHIHLPASFFQVVILLCPESGMVQEQLLDGMGILLLEAVREEHGLVNHVIETVLGQLELHLEDKTREEMEEVIFSRITYFLYHGVLEVV
jgi:hypothetical protein